jgi:twitching motility protein PilT
MIATSAIRDCIRDAGRTTEILAFVAQGSSLYGMQSFDQSLLALYRAGTISYETARQSASSPDDFDLKVRGIFSTGDVVKDAVAKRPASPEKSKSPFARP